MSIDYIEAFVRPTIPTKCFADLEAWLLTRVFKTEARGNDLGFHACWSLSDICEKTLSKDELSKALAASYEICPDLCAAVESEINRRGEIILGAVDYEKIFQSAVRRCPDFLRHISVEERDCNTKYYDYDETFTLITADAIESICTKRRYDDGNMVVPISHTRDTVGPMGRTVADVALLDSVITGAPIATAEPLRGKRLGIPAVFWSGLDRDVETLTGAARTRLADAGVVLVDVDMPGLFEQNAKVSFPVALHEPIADIPAYLEASGIKGIALADIAARIASPDVKGAFGAITADAFGAAYSDAINVHRPALQKIYQAYFRDNNLDGILFPTTIAPAPLIDAEKGSGEMAINDGKPVPTFDTMIRNTDPGSNAGLPGLSLYAGMTPGGLPVGIEIDGPVGSDTKLLGLGLSIEAILGSSPPPKI
jgi:hypothetical protein